MSAGQNGTQGVPPVGSQTVPPGLLPKARDPEAFARAMMQAQAMSQPAQRWQCAICIGTSKAWEQANRAALAPAAEAAKAAAAAGLPMPDLTALIPDEVRETMPQVAEAVTIATVPGAGLAAVCGGHAPAWTDDAARPTLLLAPGGLEMSALVKMATGG